MRDRFKKLLRVSSALVLATVVLLGTATSSASASGPELDEVEQPQPGDPDLDEDPVGGRGSHAPSTRELTALIVRETTRPGMERG